MTETPFNVEQDRAEFLRHLQALVDYAWNNRKPVVIQQYKKTTQEAEEIVPTEQIEQSTRARETLTQLTESDILHFEEEAEEPSEVLVDNPHDYLALMKMTLNKMVENGHFTREYADQAIKRDLLHEFEHHVPGLGIPDLKILYGVKFFTDANEPRFSAFQPFIRLQGKLQLGVYKDMQSAPSNLSANDEVRTQS